MRLIQNVQRRAARALILATVSVATSASAARAATIFAVDNNATTAGATSAIVRFDSATPTSFTTIGNTGVAGMTGTTNGAFGLAFDNAANLFLYGGGTNAGLYSVDQTTGAATRITGATTGLEVGDTVRDMAWNPSTNQMVLLASTGLSPTVTNKLYSIDLATGAATKIGNLTGTDSGRQMVGLGYRANGVAITYNFNTDDTLNITGTTLSSLNTTTGFVANGADRNGFDVDWNGTGAIYALFGTGSTAHQFFSVNPTTGAFTAIGGTTTRQWGDLAVAVPEPATLGLAMIGLSLAMKRRRR